MILLMLPVLWILPLLLLIPLQAGVPYVGLLYVEFLAVHIIGGERHRESEQKASSRVVWPLLLRFVKVASTTRKVACTLLALAGRFPVK